jgi:hypothetical protein
MNDRLNARFEALLIECLDALEAGEPVEQILARYPQDAAGLRPLLHTALALENAALEPSPEGERRSRDAMLMAASFALKPAPVRPHSGSGLLRAFGTLVVLLTLSGGIVLVASGSALPGQPLYGAKRFVEDVRLAMAPDAQSRAALQTAFDAERISEIQALAQSGGRASVEFTGQVDSFDGTELVVDGLSLLLEDASAIDGEIYPGAMVRVVVMVDGPILSVTRVDVLGPTATPAATDRATVTPLQPPTAADTLTPTVISTSAPQPTTLPPEPTLSETSEPDETAEPDETDDHGGGDDSGDDDGGNSGSGGGGDD